MRSTHCVLDRILILSKIAEILAKHSIKYTSATIFTTRYKLQREGEHDGFDTSIGNNQLLWHGSRSTNFAGIIKNGLKIAPPEAPVTGYMFGKGVYFADCVSKSANYCHATNS